jgi:hypothetical protein
MPTRLLPVLSRYDLPEPELQAARLDGELYRVDECYSPVDEIERRDNRALSLAVLVPERLIAEQRTAAWVLGALGDAPARHQFCADIGARVRAPEPRITVREVVLDDTDLMTCAGLRVTTPLRTAIDLARFSDAFGGRERAMIRSLMVLGGFGAGECAKTMDRRRNLPGKQRALSRISAAASYPPETRYTS